jgi:hypothetical protein
MNVVRAAHFSVNTYMPGEISCAIAIIGLRAHGAHELSMGVD